MKNNILPGGRAIRPFLRTILTSAAALTLVLQPFAFISQVNAATANVEQLVFTSSSQTLEVNEVSAQMNVQTQNSSNLSELLTSPGAKLVLTSSSATGQFSSNGNGAWNTTGEFSFNNNTANRSFYYKDAALGTHTLEAKVKDNAGVFYSWTATQTVTVIDSLAPIITPQVNAENFNTHSGSDYKGFNVGFNIVDFTEVTSVKVSLYQSDRHLVTNSHNQNLLDLINVGGATQLSTPFITIDGTYVEEYWSLGDFNWTLADKPTKAVIEVTDFDGQTYTATNLNLAEPNGWTFAKILPYQFPSTNDANKINNHPHVNLVEATTGSVTLEFINQTNSLACFEVRVDGMTVPSDAIENGCANLHPTGSVHPIVTNDIVYPGPCVDGRTNANAAHCPEGAGPRTVTFDATQKIEVRLALGGERDWDFDWTTFAVLPPQQNPDDNSGDNNSDNEETAIETPGSNPNNSQNNQPVTVVSSDTGTRPQVLADNTSNANNTANNETGVEAAATGQSSTDNMADEENKPIAAIDEEKSECSKLLGICTYWWVMAAALIGGGYIILRSGSTKKETPNISKTSGKK